MQIDMSPADIARVLQGLTMLQSSHAVHAAGFRYQQMPACALVHDQDGEQARLLARRILDACPGVSLSSGKKR